MPTPLKQRFHLNQTTAKLLSDLTARHRELNPSADENMVLSAVIGAAWSGCPAQAQAPQPPAPTVQEVTPQTPDSDFLDESALANATKFF